MSLQVNEMINEINNRIESHRRKMDHIRMMSINGTIQDVDNANTLCATYELAISNLMIAKASLLPHITTMLADTNTPMDELKRPHK